MTDSFVGEIRMFAGSNPPQGWEICQGQVVSIAEYEALFDVIGTTYGGDGVTNFGVPDLRGRVPVHQGTNPDTGTNYPMGKTGGAQMVVLDGQSMPAHSHEFQATTAPGTQANPGNSLLANSQGPQPFIQEDPSGILDSSSVQPVGGGQAHDNRQPYLAINFMISMYPNQGAGVDPFMGEITIFPYNFAPTGWAPCDGQLLTMSQHPELFSLLGKVYGGDGRSTFGLPNLQGSVPLGAGQGPGLDIYYRGQDGGEPFINLSLEQLPWHNHGIRAQTIDPGDNRIPTPNLYLGNTLMYSTARPTGTLSDAALAPTGNGVPHNNVMPYLPLTFCIAIDGIYPNPGGAD